MTAETDAAWDAYRVQRAKRRVKERERRAARRGAWGSLSREERERSSKISVAARLKQERARADLILCAMPLCKADALRHNGVSLGICLTCSFAVLNYFKEQEEQPAITHAAADREIKRIILQQRSLAETETRRISPGWVYYILIADRIKIGYSIDVKRRLRSYPPDSPLLAMHPGTKLLESEMHAKFAGSKAAGREWFLDTPELRQHIKEVIEQFGEPDRARYEHRGQHKQRNLKAS